MSLNNAFIIELPKIADHRGNLTFIENNNHIPFATKRVYYVYDVPGGAVRGGHAHRRDEEFIIAASGSFRVKITDGREHQTYYLNRSHFGLYLPSMIWRELDDFSSGSVCLVLSSNHYDEDDYHCDFDFYRKAMGIN